MKKNSLFRSICLLIRKQWWQLCSVLISSIIIIASTVYIPVFLGDCYHILETGIYKLYPFFMLSCGYILRAIFKLVRNHLTASLGTTVVCKLRMELCHHIVNDDNQIEQDSTYLNNILSHELDTISNIISWRPFVLLENICILLWSFFRVKDISRGLLVFLIPILLSALFISSIYGNNIKKAFSNLKKHLYNLSSVVAEVMSAQKLIRTLNIQSNYEQKFEIQNEKILTANLDIAKKTRTAKPLLELISYLAMIISVVACSITVIKQNLPASLVVTIYSYMITMARLCADLPNNVQFYVDAAQSVKRIEVLYSNSHAEYKTNAPSSNFESICSINIDHVSSYIKGKILWNIPHLDLPEGKILVINSVSGSGKSTFCDILANSFSSFTGNILINQQRLNDINPAQYRKKIGYAMQLPVIFADTVTGNIRMGRTTLPAWEKKVFNACAIDEIQQRYRNEKINGDTNSLSGGERQRIEIARALYALPDLILLDDVFTALDAPRRKAIMDLLSYYKKGHITVIVSSYPDVIEYADYILELGSNSMIHEEDHAKPWD